MVGAVVFESLQPTNEFDKCGSADYSLYHHWGEGRRGGTKHKSAEIFTRKKPHFKHNIEADWLGGMAHMPPPLASPMRTCTWKDFNTEMFNFSLIYFYLKGYI